MKEEKGLDDKTKSKEGVMYTAGAFDADGTGPSKHVKTMRLLTVSHQFSLLL